MMDVDEMFLRSAIHEHTKTIVKLALKEGGLYKGEEICLI